MTLIVKPTLPLSDHVPFDNATVAFAVDVSGSTAGLTLSAEQHFVRSVASLLSPKSQLMAKILPWNNIAQSVRGLSQLDTLYSGGYTIPGAIIVDTACRTALEQTSLWFLLTDGMVDEQHRKRFAELTAESGLHGTACVTVIFGNPRRGQPGSCNISVGVSVYAVVPNCLFLFYDIVTHKIMVMQSKGIFKSLLDNAENPVIDDNTTWESFPRISIEEFKTLVIPPPRKLCADEIALQDDLIVKFDELWSNRLSQEQVSKILSNDEEG